MAELPVKNGSNWLRGHSMVYNGLELLAPRRYECISLIDLSYEALNIEFGQGTTKIFEVKVKKICRLVPIRRQQIFLPPILTFDIFAAPQSKSMFSISFKRSHIYLFGAKSPRPWYDF